MKKKLFLIFPRPRRRAFTLLELLVVVVVVGILVGLAMIRFGNTQEKAYRATMQNDLRNYATAQALHNSEHQSFADGPATLTGYALSDGVMELSHMSESASRWRLVVGHAKSEWRCSMQGGPNGAGPEAGAPYCVEGSTLSFTVSDNAPPAETEIIFNATDAILSLAMGEEASAFAALLAADPSEIESVAWNYGDGSPIDMGTTDTHTIRRHTYSIAGEYTASLTLTKKDGSDGVATQVIRVSPPANNAPMASFSFTVSGLMVEFDASGSTDPDDDALTYTWEFGDGTEESSSSATIQHTYADNSARTVWLTVRDAGGKEGTTSRQLAPNAPPVASFSFSPTSPEAGDTVWFDAAGSSDPEGTALSFSWDFGWGEGKNGVESFAIFLEGDHSVELTATDAEGVSQKIEQLVSVSPRALPSISGAHASHAVQPGATYSDTVTITNPSNRARTLKIHAGSSGAGNVVESVLQPDGTAHANLEDPYFEEFAAGESKDVVFTIEISETALAGASAQVEYSVQDFHDSAIAQSALHTLTVGEVLLAPTVTGGTSDHSIAPGESHSETVTVRNNSNTARSFIVHGSKLGNHALRSVVEPDGTDHTDANPYTEMLTAFESRSFTFTEVAADSALGGASTSVHIWAQDQIQLSLVDSMKHTVSIDTVIKAPTLTHEHHENHTVAAGEKDNNRLTLKNNSNVRRTFDINLAWAGAQPLVVADADRLDLVLEPFESFSWVPDVTIKSGVTPGTTAVLSYRAYDEEFTNLESRADHTVTLVERYTYSVSSGNLSAFNVHVTGKGHSVSPASTPGNSALRLNGYYFIEGKQNIPYNPSRLYHVKYRMRQITDDPNASSQAIHAGLMGVGADGVRRYRFDGANGTSPAIYYGASGVVTSAAQGEYIFNAYATGLASELLYWNRFGRPNDSPTSPSQAGPLYTGSAYLRPMIMINHPDTGSNAIADLYDIIVEVI